MGGSWSEKCEEYAAWKCVGFMYLLCAEHFHFHAAAVDTLMVLAILNANGEGDTAPGYVDSGDVRDANQLFRRRRSTPQSYASSNRKVDKGSRYHEAQAVSNAQCSALLAAV